MAAGFAEEAVDDGMGILRSREHALVVLCRQADTMTLKPLVGIAMVELFEKALQQTVATRIDLRQVANVGKGIGTVTMAPARDLNLGQHTLAALQDGDIHLGHHLLQVDGQEEACRTTANDSRLHLRMMVTSPPRPNLMMLDGVCGWCSWRRLQQT